MLPLREIKRQSSCWAGEILVSAEACQTLQDKSKSAVQCIIKRLMKANLIRKSGTLNRAAYYYGHENEASISERVGSMTGRSGLQRVRR